VQPSLAVFFSHGVSLATWSRTGMSTKEVGYYRALEKSFGSIVFVTYDQPADELPTLIASLGTLGVVYNRWRLPYQLFGFVAPLLHFRALRRATLLKTNQLNGAWTAVLAKWLLRKPLVVRCGHVPSRHGVLDPRAPRGRLRVKLVVALEKLAVRTADLVFAATPSDIRYLVERHGIDESKTRHVPTPIDAEQFAPRTDVAREENLVVYVGRLVEEKNVHLLVDACQSLPGVKLRLIGTGPLEAELRAKSDPARVQFVGAVPNVELPRHLAEASVFVLPSDYEGSPKALLEAMAAGVAVVGTRVDGIREIVDDGRTGLLCDRSSDAIRTAIDRLLRDASLRARLGAAAREFVVRGYSQRDVVRRETEYLSALLP
jgi:glycosyltransferase involved in cell wall biosynthesis